ncbi:MAG: pyridoxal-phosphate dependent enzyme [Propionibacteriaceae bacterium]|jgi:threonine synthase|nr:pyridoxal-phosphate dependent enzyme [Propionibacteriaceae bacterium]
MKYQLHCLACSRPTADFGDWFAQGQRCACGSPRADLVYQSDYAGLDPLLRGRPESFWHYFDFLPLLDRSHLVTRGEGVPELQRWDFLEDHARRHHGLDCRVVAARNDLNGGTGTFKDVAAAMAAALFQEWGVARFVIASTGNIATAYAAYLAWAGVELTAFLPQGHNQSSAAEIRRLGQEVRVIPGTYADAKRAAADFAARHHLLISAGNIDPIRVESKRTMVFEFLRQLGRLPDVYLQAVSGGTGPIALDKGLRELSRVGWQPAASRDRRAPRPGPAPEPAADGAGPARETSPLTTAAPRDQLPFLPTAAGDGSDPGQSAGWSTGERRPGGRLVGPRLVLSQLDTCDPMVQGWERAVAAGFPAGWERSYPVIERPATAVTTLATGDPAMFPTLAPLVQTSGGAFVRVREAELVAGGRWLAAESGLTLGPASIACLLGFDQALAQGLIHDGDLVALNPGEGAGRAGGFARAVAGEAVLTPAS